MIYTRKKGSVLVFSLIVLSIVLSTALSITAVNVSNRKSAASTAQSVQSFQTADTATEKVMKAIYNGNYADLTALYNAIKDTNPGAPASTCPGVLNLAVAGGVAQVKFSDTSGVALVNGDCTSTLWRDTVARVKVEGSGSASGGATRVIEVGIAPLSSMAWGANGSGQLGDGTTGTDRLSPVSTVGGSKWKSVSAGDSHVLAVRTDGTLWAWGEGGNGRLGRGSNTDASSPIQIGTDTDWESVSAGESHSLGIKTNHTLWAWGNGGQYRLGNNSTNDVYTPTQISACASSCPAGGWKSVSAGLIDHSLAVGMDSTLWSWGDGGRYKLGNNSTNNVHIPTQIGTGNTCNSAACPPGWKSISAGDLYSIAIGTDDKLYVWGSGTNYQLGTNSTNDEHTPRLIPTPAGATWLSVAAGENHVLGIRSDGANNGTLWSWGSNAEGQLGKGSTGGNDVQTPQQIGSSTDWKFVSAGYRHSSALKTNGTNRDLHVWGNNNHGQVGDGGTSNTGNVGTPVAGNWQTVDGGNTFSVGVRR
ncbi:MAG: hypothetical protein WAU28_01905 [Candidatus Moraniibacteriota bacterium]